MKDIIICTHVSDHLYNSIGAHKLVKSIKYFHPELDLIVFGDETLNKIMDEDPRINWNNIHPIVSYILTDHYKTIIHMDADSMLTDRIDELLENVSKYDVIGVRNTNDYHKAGKDNPIGCENVHYAKYINAGLVAVSNKEFYKDWIDLNFKLSNHLPFGENDTLNMLFHSGNYSSHIIDDFDTDLYYGLSNVWGEKNHWESWKQIYIDNDKLKLNNKKVKVLHQAGGSMPVKLDFNQFTDSVKNYLEKICY